MSIRPFINLSLDFYILSEGDALKGFMLQRYPQRLTETYTALSTEDKLRIHGIIDNENYMVESVDTSEASSRQTAMILATRNRIPSERLEQRLDFLESSYGWLLVRQKSFVLKVLNDKKISDDEAYAKVKFLGCIPVYIALDLGNVLNEKPIAPHPSPFGAVQV